MYGEVVNEGILDIWRQSFFQGTTTYSDTSSDPVSGTDAPRTDLCVASGQEGRSGPSFGPNTDVGGPGVLADPAPFLVLEQGLSRGTARAAAERTL